MRVLKRIYCKLHGHKQSQEPYDIVERNGLSMVLIPMHYKCSRCNKKLIRPLFDYEIMPVITGRVIYE